MVKSTGSNTMTSPTTFSQTSATPSLTEATDTRLTARFEHFCLMAGVDSLTPMMDEDVTELAGEYDGHNAETPGYRWGSTRPQSASLAARSLSSVPGCATRRRMKRWSSRVGMNSPPMAILDSRPWPSWPWGQHPPLPRILTLIVVNSQLD